MLFFIPASLKEGFHLVLWQQVNKKKNMLRSLEFSVSIEPGKQYLLYSIGSLGH